MKTSSAGDLYNCVDALWVSLPLPLLLILPDVYVGLTECFTNFYQLHSIWEAFWECDGN